MLTFAHLWVVLLAPLPLLVVWIVPPRQQVVPAVRVPFLARLKGAGGHSGPSVARSSWPLAVQAVVWLLLLTALARPQWLEAPIERIVPVRDLLLLLDLSGSMDQRDFTSSDGQQVDRLTAAKQVLGDFLMRREGDRVGLVVFGSSPFLQVPFTTDLELCRQLLNETAVGMAGPRTVLGDAVGMGINLFENSDAPDKTMILLTDGNDAGSSVPPLEAARVARDHDITIHAIAMGDPTTAGEEKIDEESLRKITATTPSGSFFLALDREQLNDIYRQLDEIETQEINTVSHRPRRDLYHWPLATAWLTFTIFQVWPLMARNTIRARKVPITRLRVNPRTFELETTE